MKRKDVHDVTHDDFSFPSRSRKFMRLDGGELLSVMEEDPATRVPPPLENQWSTLPTPTSSNAQPNAPFIDTNTVPSSHEGAIVLYNPSNTPFFKSPSSPDFSIIINSDFFPGLKNRLFWQPDLLTMKPIEDKATENGSCKQPNDCLAVVPWVAPQPLTSGAETRITAPLQQMEAEDMEGEMMDTDNSDNNIAGKASLDGEMVKGAETFELGPQEQQIQNQHCLTPQFSQNMYTPVTW
ncbi:hypothetical protein DITRI_Ditri10aG0147200 [Diplodiscus trichospermus]